jgi:hypothetical protein
MRRFPDQPIRAALQQMTTRAAVKLIAPMFYNDRAL